MSQKPTRVVLIGALLIFIVVFLYVNFKKEPVAVTTDLAPTQTQNYEGDIITTLTASWGTVNTLVPMKPEYHNQAQNKSGVWSVPYIIQFIGKDNLLVEIEDDNNAHTAVLHYEGGQFTLLKFLKNEYNFSSAEYQNIISTYGDTSYTPSTYTIGLVRDKKIVSFPDLTKVRENIFLKGYATASAGATLK